MTSKSASAVSNVRWVATSQIARVVIQLVSISIFARLLPTSDFGLLAMATIVTNFAFLIRDMGTAAALVQKGELTDELLDTVFWSNVLFGLVSGAMVALGSPLIAMVFHEPALQKVLLLLAVTFPLGSSGTSHLALLERASRFRVIAMAEIISALAGATVGITAAWQGAGIISLILQTLITAFLATCLFWALSTWRPTLRWSSNEFLGLLHFSGNLVSFNVINYFARNMDGVLIGKFLGPVELGIYNVAYRVMLFPIANLSVIISRAMFPIYSRQQQQAALIGKNYLKTLTLISVVTAPLMFGLWAVRESFVEVALGQKWESTAAIIAWLAPTGYLQSLVSTTGVALMAKGRTKLLRNLGIVSSVLFIISFILGLSQGAVGVSRAYFFANILASLIALHYTLADVTLTLNDLFRSVARPLACAILMTFVVFLADRFMPDSTPAVVRLTFLIALGASLYLFLLLVFLPTALRQVRDILIKPSA